MPDDASDKHTFLDYATPPRNPPQTSRERKSRVPGKPWLKASVYTAIATLLVYALSTLIASLFGSTSTAQAVAAFLMLSIWIWLVLIKVFLAQASSDRKHHAKAMSVGLAAALFLLAGAWASVSISGCIEEEQQNRRNKATGP